MKRFIATLIFVLFVFGVTKAEDIDTPLSDCSYMSLDVSFATDAQVVLNRINQMRWEACQKGFPYPGATNGRSLKPSEYKPLVWSTDLERLCRLKSVESAVSNYTDQRPNGLDKGAATSNGVRYNRALYLQGKNLFQLLNDIYSDKENWKNGTVSSTNNYALLINPGYKYIGTSYLSDNKFLCLMLSSDDLSSKSHTILDENYPLSFAVQVRRDYLKSTRLVPYLGDGSVNTSSTITMTADDQLNLKVQSQYTNNGKTTYLDYYGDYTFTSSNSNVVKVINGHQIQALKKGTATIYAKVNGTTLCSKTVTVNCNHDYVYGPVNATTHKISGTCSKCNATITGTVPTKFEIRWRNSSSSDIGYYETLQSPNPIGSYIQSMIMENMDGDEAFKTLLIECSDPYTLECPEQQKFAGTVYHVLKAGTVTVTIKSKFNPSLKHSYTFKVGDN